MRGVERELPPARVFSVLFSHHRCSVKPYPTGLRGLNIGHIPSYTPELVDLKAREI
jgi:hypothetical protein